jgi:hypothetical protein
VLCQPGGRPNAFPWVTPAEDKFARAGFGVGLLIYPNHFRAKVDRRAGMNLRPGSVSLAQMPSPCYKARAGPTFGGGFKKRQIGRFWTASFVSTSGRQRDHPSLTSADHLLAAAGVQAWAFFKPVVR